MENLAIVAVIMAYEGKCWPFGKVSVGKG